MCYDHIGHNKNNTGLWVELHQITLVVEIQECSTHVRQDVTVMFL